MARTDNYTLGPTEERWRHRPGAGGLGTLLDASSASQSSHKSAITVRCLNDADDDGGDGGLRWMDKVGAMGSTLVNALISVGRLTDDHESRPSSSARRTYKRMTQKALQIVARSLAIRSSTVRHSSSLMTFARLLTDFIRSEPLPKFGTDCFENCFENVLVLDCSDFATLWKTCKPISI